MKQGILFILSGPSGSGKTTLTKKLLESRELQGVLVKSVSATTRGPRPGERHGQDYFYISEKMFRYKIRAGHFLEWENVFHSYYGTPRKNLFLNLRRGKSVILCIDVKGAKTVARKFPKACRIFIQPPSMAILKKRLENRKSESSKEMTLRLKAARVEMKETRFYDLVVINDDLSAAYQFLVEFIRCKINDRDGAVSKGSRTGRWGAKNHFDKAVGM